jgi:hypothetical protein
VQVTGEQPQPACHIKIPDSIQGDGSARIRPITAKEGVPGQASIGTEFGDESVAVCCVPTYWSSPTIVAISCYVDIPAPVHSDARGQIAARSTQEGVPDQAARRVQFGDEGIAASGEIPQATGEQVQLAPLKPAAYIFPFPSTAIA